MIKRKLKQRALELSKKFPVLAVVGPRQSGKTTLVKDAFAAMDYVNLEEPDTRQFAQNDPRSFLTEHSSGVIIDEIQRVPELFSYIQSIVDKRKSSGQFVITGSQHILLHENISQTLAGRVAILSLLPFSYEEIKGVTSSENVNNFLFKGFYPPIYDRKMEPADWYSNYITTYVERDVRLVKNVTNLNSFGTFIKMCAGRIGQLLNLSSLANEIGITVNTAKAWISLLETSFVLFRLHSYHKSFNKRLVKMPKLYFYDVGLASNLLGIQKAEQIQTHYSYGNLFENFVVVEIMKYYLNRGFIKNIYFWRDKLGREIDLILEDGGTITPLEIKAGKTITTEFVKNLEYWNLLTGNSSTNSYLIYGGDQRQKRKHFSVLPWYNFNEIFRK